jgi:HK97 gp10 family phage protein
VAQLVTVDGLKQVEKTLRDVTPRESRNIMRRLVVRIAASVRDDVRKAARSVVKRRTGNLFKAIRSKREKGRPDVFEASVIVHLKKDGSPRAPHWHFIEFGTVKQSARPFIAPTVLDWQSKMPQVYREEFGKQLEREIAKREKRK